MKISQWAGSRSLQSTSLPGSVAELEEGLALHQIPCLRGGLARPSGGERLVDHLPAVGGILLEVLHERVAQHRRHLAGDLAVPELRLGLTLELRLAELDADDRGETVADVVTGEVRILFLQDACLARVLVQRRGERAAEPGDVRAALLGVHVVRERQDVLREHRVLVLERDLDDVAVDLPLDVHRLGVDHVPVRVEVTDERLDAALEMERVRQGRAFVGELDRDALVEERIAAQRVGHRLPRELDLRKDLGVGPETDVCAALVGFAGDGDGSVGDAARVLLPVRLAVEVDLDDEALTQRVDDGQPDAVQTARNLVASAAELSSSVERREDDLER